LHNLSMMVIDRYKSRGRERIFQNKKRKKQLN